MVQKSDTVITASSILLPCLPQLRASSVLHPTTTEFTCCAWCCWLLPQIIISWFLSPLAAALIAFIIFVAVRTVVLRRAKSTDIAFYVLPVLILITIWVVRAWLLVQQMVNCLLLVLPLHSGSPSSCCC
jgi:hypothetical protein